MRNYKTYIVILLITISNISLLAQTPWSLEQCIQHALDNNIQVKQQEVVVEQNKNNLTQSKYNLLPSVNAGADYSFGWGRVLDNTTYQFINLPRSDNSSLSVSSSVPLFAGLQKQNIIKRNDIDLKASIQNVEKLKNDIALNVAAAYLQILLAKESIAIAEQQLIATKEQIERTKKMVDAGRLTLSNLLDLQAQQASEEAQLVRSHNALDIADVSLRQLLEITTTESFDIITPELLSVPEELEYKSLQQMYEDALSIMPEIKASELRLKSAERSLAISKGGYFPTLNLGASYNTRYSNAPSGVDPSTGIPIAPLSIWEQFRENRATAVGLNLSIPIFGGMQTRTQVKNAKLNIRYQELELQRAKNTLYLGIQQAQTDAMGFLKSYQAANQNINAIKEAFYYTEKKFDAGSVTATDYMVAKNNLFKAQSDCIQAKYQYVFKMKILDFYKGLPIKL